MCARVESHETRHGATGVSLLAEPPSALHTFSVRPQQVTLTIWDFSSLAFFQHAVKISFLTDSSTLMVEELRTSGRSLSDSIANLHPHLRRRGLSEASLEQRDHQRIAAKVLRKVCSVKVLFWGKKRQQRLCGEETAHSSPPPCRPSSHLSSCRSPSFPNGRRRSAAADL